MPIDSKSENDLDKSLRFSLRSRLSIALLAASILAIFHLYAQQSRTFVDLDTDKRRIREKVFNRQNMLDMLQRSNKTLPVEIEANHAENIQGSSNNTLENSHVAYQADISQPTKTSDVQPEKTSDVQVQPQGADESQQEIQPHSASDAVSDSDQVFEPQKHSDTQQQPINTEKRNSDEIQGEPQKQPDPRQQPKNLENKPDKRFFLTVCTMVKNEACYIVEWIEHYRIMGVDRIVIFDHDSMDNVTLVKDLYAQHAPDFAIHVHQSLVRNSTQLDRNLQEMNLQMCLDLYGGSTEWMANLDVDEFIYSPQYGTLADHLRNLTAIERATGRRFSSVVSVNLNFGTSGQLHRFDNALARSPDGRVEYRNPCGPQFITDHVLRGPATVIFGEAQEYQARDIRHEKSERRALTAGTSRQLLMPTAVPACQSPASSPGRPSLAPCSLLALPFPFLLLLLLSALSSFIFVRVQSAAGSRHSPERAPPWRLRIEFLLLQTSMPARTRPALNIKGFKPAVQICLETMLSRQT